MISAYLLMLCVSLVSCWPLTLILLSVATVVLLHTESWVMKVAVVAFAGFLAFAALQFGTIVHSYTSFRTAGEGDFVYSAGKESR